MSNKGKNELGATRVEIGLSFVIAGLVMLAFVLLDYISGGDVNSPFAGGAIPAAGAVLVGIYLLSKTLNIRVREKGPSIKKAPGANLLILVEYLYPPKTVEEVFKPIVADLRTEYFDALKEVRNRKAGWIRVRYTFSFVMAMGLSKALSVIRSVARR